MVRPAKSELTSGIESVIVAAAVCHRGHEGRLRVLGRLLISDSLSDRDVKLISTPPPPFPDSVGPSKCCSPLILSPRKDTLTTPLSNRWSRERYRFKLRWSEKKFSCSLRFAHYLVYSAWEELMDRVSVISMLRCSHQEKGIRSTKSAKVWTKLRKRSRCSRLTKRTKSKWYSNGKSRGKSTRTKAIFSITYPRTGSLRGDQFQNLKI